VSTADWIAIAVLLSAIVGPALTAYWQTHRRGTDDDAVSPAEQRVLALTPEDKALLASLRDAIKAMALAEQDRRLLVNFFDICVSLRDAALSLGRRLDSLNNELADVRRATDDNTDALRRRS
jgi:hypothetical protein